MSYTTIDFDPILGRQLRDFRIKHSTKAKDISAHIGKSAAYLSKLEKGGIKHISKAELIKILDFITDDNYGLQSFIDDICVAQNIEYIHQSLLISNYDWIDRKIPVPDSYIEHIKSKMSTLQISLPELVSYINTNEDLDNSFFYSNKIDKSLVTPNVWYSYCVSNNSDSEQHSYIMVDIETSHAQGILDKNIHQTNYLHLYAMLYHLYKLEAKSAFKPLLDDNDKRKIQDNVTQYLQNEKIYTTFEKKVQLLRATENTADTKFSNIDAIKNRAIIYAINNKIAHISAIDQEYTNDKLISILENLNTFDSFALAYMALDIRKLAEISSPLKKEFLYAVQELIEKYSSIQDDKIEKY